jgi:predicted nucleic acid-binding protein
VAESPSVLSVVLDASVALSAVFPDEVLNAPALALLLELAERDAVLLAPPLWESETSSAVRLRVAQKKSLAPPLESLVYSLLDALPVQIVHDSNVNARARQLAVFYNRNRVYDSTYLALAQLHGLEFWTADERLFNAVAGQDAPKGKTLPFVRFLGDFTALNP